MNGRRSLKSRWKAEAFRTALVSDSVRAVLLLLSDHMGADGYVSVPRSKLAEELGRSPRRVTERLQVAVDAGLLARVSRGYEGHTAVYRALLPTPERVSKTSTLSGCGRVHPPFIHSVRERPSLGGADGGSRQDKGDLRFRVPLAKRTASRQTSRNGRRALRVAASTSSGYQHEPRDQSKRSGARAMSSPRDQARISRPDARLEQNQPLEVYFAYGRRLCYVEARTVGEPRST